MTLDCDKLAEFLEDTAWSIARSKLLSIEQSDVYVYEHKNQYLIGDAKDVCYIETLLIMPPELICNRTLKYVRFNLVKFMKWLFSKYDEYSLEKALDDWIAYSDGHECSYDKDHKIYYIIYNNKKHEVELEWCDISYE